MKKIIFFGLFFVISFSARCEIKVENIEYMGWNSIKVDNGLLRLVIIPELGGRIVEIHSYLSGNNLIRIAPWFIRIPPDKLAHTGEYGGISDIGSLGWPGYFWDKKYDVEISKDIDRCMVIGKVCSDSIYLERVMEIKEQSTRIKFTIIMKNMDEKPLDLVARLHGEFRVGKKADENDVFFWVSDGKLKLRRYKPSDLVRFSIDTVDGGWCGVVDEKEKEAIIKIFYPMDQKERVLWWAGFLEGDPSSIERDDTGGFYNFDRYSRPVKVLPKDSIKSHEDLCIISGLSSLNYVDEKIVAGMKISKKIVGSEGIDLEIGIAGFENIEETYCSEVEIQKDNMAIIKKEASFKNLIPGRADIKKIRFETKSLQDGNYKIVWRVLREGKVLKEITDDFEIARKVIDEYLSMIDQEKVLLKKIIGSKKQYYYPYLKNLLTYMIGRQEEDFAKGNFEEMKKRHQRFLSYISEYR